MIEIIKRKLHKLNNTSIYEDSLILDSLALMCDKGSDNENLFYSSALYLYAYVNGSKLAEFKLREYGCCPEYLREIILLIDDPMFDEAEIIDLINVSFSTHWVNLKTLISNSILFVEVLRNIGLLLLNKYYVGEEYELAILLLLSAADSSIEDDIASFHIGNFYFEAQDYELSYKYYKKSSDKGNAEAIYALSSFYHFGIGGITKNQDKALELLYIAAKLESERALNRINTLK